MKVQIVRWGNNLAVRIPKPIAKKAAVKEGDHLELEASEGQIYLRRSRRKNVPTLESLVSEVTAKNRYAEISTGHAVGKEDIEW